VHLEGANLALLSVHLGVEPVALALAGADLALEVLLLTHGNSKENHLGEALEEGVEIHVLGQVLRGDERLGDLAALGGTTGDLFHEALAEFLAHDGVVELAELLGEGSVV
jgi:hypothetical protein